MTRKGASRSTSAPPSAEPESLISLRAAVTLFFASAVGGVAGILTHLAGDSLATATLTAGATFGASAAIFHKLVGKS
ncbi:hypothetical protein AB0M47_10805 [Hamadaea sp. NPDC051192]|uniref:hypothetical protein n=1 Tax=Hamadaea sp. NPDC051192 TaxID=3154940 RepID=UPI00343C25CC